MNRQFQEQYKIFRLLKGMKFFNDTVLPKFHDFFSPKTMRDQVTLFWYKINIEIL